MDKIPKRVVPKEKADYESCLENVTFSIKDGLLRMTVFIGYFDEVY